MPGKFSRRIVTPNKPAVCHKKPIAALPLVIMPYDRPANVFFKWDEAPVSGTRRRSWATQAIANSHMRMQIASGLSGGVNFSINLYFSQDGKLYDYAVNVWDVHFYLLTQTRLRLPLVDRNGWTTGLIQMEPNFHTTSCSFEVLA